jgi:hypothetical protein
MPGARHGWLHVAAVLVAACFSLLLFPPPAAAAAAVKGRDAQPNTERISGDLSLLCLVLILIGGF